MKKQIVVYAVIGILLFVGLVAGAAYLYQSNTSKTADTSQVQPKPTETIDDKSVTYKGQDGMTALELLEQAATVEMSGTGENAFVNAINGITADPKSEFWSFNVNGQSAPVGAGSYITKDSDTIVWELSSF